METVIEVKAKRTTGWVEGLDGVMVQIGHIMVSCEARDAWRGDMTRTTAINWPGMGDRSVLGTAEFMRELQAALIIAGELEQDFDAAMAKHGW